MQRLFKYILTFLCALLVFPIQVHAADIYTEGYLEYRVEDDAISICGYFGSESEVTVPAFIAGYPVSEIASGAFEDAETVEKVNLPDTIMRIEEGAFGRNQTVVYDSNTSDPKPTVMARRHRRIRKMQEHLRGTAVREAIRRLAPERERMVRLRETTAATMAAAGRVPEMRLTVRKTAQIPSLGAREMRKQRSVLKIPGTKTARRMTSGVRVIMRIE